MNNELLEIYEQLHEGKTDSFGNTISVKEEDDSLRLLLVEAGKTRVKHIGFFHVREDSLVFHKREKEKDLHRKTFSWTIPKFVVDMVDEVEYVTETAIYNAKESVIARCGFYLPYKSNNQGYMKKVFLRISHWTVHHVNDKIGNRFNYLFGNEWYRVLQDKIKCKEFYDIGGIVNSRRAMVPVYPEKNKVFEAFKLTPYMDVKVVIMGKEPYCKENYSHGLAYSVDSIDMGATTPQTLQNIGAEVESDYGNGFYLNVPTNLTPWARQGVFLINTILTVEKNSPNSHSEVGWQKFVESAILALMDRNSTKPIVFMLWGKDAQKYEGLIDHDKHLVLKAPSPSALTAHKGFLGCGHFTKCNDFLEQTEQTPILW